MPFYDDSGIRTEEHRGPFLSAFATFFDQVERMLALNLAWAGQILPLVAFFAFPNLPLAVRIFFLLWTGCALIPATALLFGMVGRACGGEMLRFDLAMELLRALTPRSLLVLAPLYSLFAWLAGLALLAVNFHLMLLDVLARLALLFAAVFAVHWGPLFAAHPERSALAVLLDSARLTWRHPGASLLAGLLVALIWAFGIFSIAGVVLAAPVLAALIQTRYYLSLTEPRSKRWAISQSRD